MTGHSYATSARTAEAGWPARRLLRENESYMLNVLRMHRDASYEIDASTRCLAEPRRRRPAGVGSRRCDGEEYGVA
ncbi:MAG: hypothetical protein R2713_01010 [Ilumatobacteraceae bacterium]